MESHGSRVLTKSHLKRRVKGRSPIALFIQTMHLPHLSRVNYPALFMMILENLQKTCDETNLAICLKNRLVFESVLPSSSPLTPARKSMAG
jgi:hypothetical protein